jgi:hypothetical protein
VVLLDSVPRYLKMRVPTLMIIGPLLGLIYVVLVPVMGVITIVLLMLWRTRQLLGRAVRRDFSGHLQEFSS